MSLRIHLREDVDHLLLHFYIASLLWWKLLRWFRIQRIIQKNGKDALLLGPLEEKRKSRSWMLLYQHLHRYYEDREKEDL